MTNDHVSCVWCKTNRRCHGRARHVLENRKFARKEKKEGYKYSPSLIRSFLFGCEFNKDNWQSAFRSLVFVKYRR